MTEQETMQGLRACWEHKDCSKCPFILNLNDCHSELAHEAYKTIERVQAENAALSERLEKAIELPYEVGSTVYSICETDEEDKFNPWIDAGRVVSFSIDVNLWIYVRYNSGLTMWYTKDSLDKEVCITFEAAEARLAELKEGKE